MSYLNQAQDPRRRATAIVTAGAFNALLAAGLVTGLATNFTTIVEKPFVARDFRLPPPPPPDPTPPPPETAVSRPVAPVPPLPLPLPPPTGPQVDSFDGLANNTTSRLPDTGPVADPLPPSRPAPGFPAKGAAPRNGSWITDADYSRRAIMEGAEGSVGFRLVIGTTGRVSSCELTRPSGLRVLDEATCRLISNRARFEAATDETGAKVVGTYTGSVVWQLPD
jgi:protein TonB